MNLALHPALAVSLSALLAVAVIGDLRQQRIPNWLSLGGVMLGVALQAAGRGSEGAGAALLGALVGGLLLFPLWLLRGMAAGDIKLMAAVGAHLGPSLAALAVVATLIAGAVLALAVLHRNRRARLASLDSTTGARTFAYAPAIAAGSAVAGTLPLWLGLVQP